MTEEAIPKFAQLSSALAEFVTVEGTQAQAHIRPLHQYITIRLVLEGGFLPEEITPRPPLTVEVKKGKNILTFSKPLVKLSERTVLGGLKTKAIDVVITKDGVGPVVAISVKGTGNAFRNLTNRMEEAIGDSTNLHIMYPGLVYAFLHVIKATPKAEAKGSNDVAIDDAGRPVNSIAKYHEVLLGLSGRRLIRDDYTRYESVALAMVKTSGDQKGRLLLDYPVAASPLNFSKFFETVYSVYDLRYPFLAPALEGLLRRREWDEDSPAIRSLSTLGTEIDYQPRIS